MDLAKLASETRTIQILNPADGRETGLSIVVRSKESDEVKAVQRRWQNSLLRSQRKFLSAEDVDRQGYDMIVASVVSWDWGGDATWDGERPECTPERIREILSDPRGGFIRDQVDTAFGDQSGFFST